MSKPRRLPLQVGSGNSGPSGYLPVTAGTSSESEAGPANVLFGPDSDSVRFETSAIGCKVSARDAGSRNRQIQVMCVIDGNILVSFEHRSFWIEVTIGLAVCEKCIVH